MVICDGCKGTCSDIQDFNMLPVPMVSDLFLQLSMLLSLKTTQRVLQRLSCLVPRDVIEMHFGLAKKIIITPKKLISVLMHTEPFHSLVMKLSGISSG